MEASSKQTDASSLPYAIVVGRIGVDPLYVIGPFATSDEAEAATKQFPAAYVDRLISPAIALREDS